MQSPSLDIVIVDFNSGHLIRDCVKSIAETDRGCFLLKRMVIVDNASDPPSQECFGDPSLPVDLIINNRNCGFAAACNQGASGSKADYLLFLNPDTQLKSDSISIPIDFMESPKNTAIGICGIQLVDERGHVRRTCARFPTFASIVIGMFGLARKWPRLFRTHFMEEWDHGHSRPVDQVMGAFYLIRRSLFESLGGFDETFFVYYEEVDLAFRARMTGMQTFYIADAQAFHLGGASSSSVLPERLYYSLRSRILYAKKHFTRIELYTLTALTMGFESVARIISSFLPGTTYKASTIIKAIGMFLPRNPFNRARPDRGNSPN